MIEEIRKKMDSVKKKIHNKDERIDSLKDERFSLVEEYEVLEIELALVDIPIISVSLYYDESDEFNKTGDFETEDALDKRLDLITSCDGKHAILYAGAKGLKYGWAQYSMEENPLKKVCSGKAKFVYSKYGENVKYESDVMDSPNNAQGLIYFFRAMHYTEDTGHCFLEGYNIKEENGISIVEFVAGS